MKFLIDTNIFIPLEPAQTSDVDGSTPAAMGFARLVAEAKSQLYVHPAQRKDIEHDRDVARRSLRSLLFEKYPCLPNPPAIAPALEREVGHADPGTNDWVDHSLLAALEADAADFLVTEDQRLRKKGVRLGLENRVATLGEAISLVRDLFDRTPMPPPAVETVKAHVLDQHDPIFDSFRRDYLGFDEWLVRCKREHRQAWAIRGTGSSLAAVCIVKPERAASFLPSGKILKICSFKVSEAHNGFRFGELMLKAVFAHAVSNRYDWLYVTVFEKHDALVSLLQDFGFDETGGRTGLGEVVLSKPMSFTEEERQALHPLSFSIRYGPFAVNLAGVPTFVVPIKPQYHAVLFPEAERQLPLLPGLHPCGNSIRKAYLSLGSIRRITPGSNLLFYRSEDKHHIGATGVVEDTLVSSSSEQIARYVGKRTVYSYEEIVELSAKKVLAILFRQSRDVSKPIPLKELRANGVLKAAPQSIATVPEETKGWLQARIGG